MHAGLYACTIPMCWQVCANHQNLPFSHVEITRIVHVGHVEVWTVATLYRALYTLYQKRSLAFPQTRLPLQEVWKERQAIYDKLLLIKCS